MTMRSQDMSLFDRVKATWSTDEKLKDIIARLFDGQLVKIYKWNGQTLIEGNRLIEGTDDQLQNGIIAFCHATPMARH